MPEIGVMTTEFDESTLEEIADRITQHGITSVQLHLASLIPEVPTGEALLHGLDVLGERISGDLARHARDVLESCGITVAAVDGTYNMIHPDPVRRNRNLDHLLRLIDLAREFGTSIVTLCTGTRDDIMWRPSEANQSEDAWRNLVEPMRVAAAAAEANGVQLAFEPEYNNVVNSARQARRLMDELGSPAVKVLMDAANIFHQGDLDHMQDHLGEAFDLVGADIALAHAKDLDHDGDAGGRAAGMGRLDYAFYLSALKSHGFVGTVVLHQLKELAPDRLDQAFGYVRDHAPPGYLR